MKNIGKAVVIALLTALAAGCGVEDEEPEGVIPEAYNSALEKADNVEGLLQDSQKKRLEEAD